ncbi:MAG: acyltransferase [Robiginitomaculum sp.]|nr:acyltransferase [Robiginitomaculum sp.]
MHFVALDGFRGVLAIMIAIYHTMWMTHINSSVFFTNGPALVDLFFVFSGFLMFTLYNDRINTSGDARTFIKRRFARIYPLHFFMLLVALLYAVARTFAHAIGLATYTQGEILPFQSGASETLWSFVTNLTLTHSMGIHDSLSYNMPSWTVSVEFYTYFVLVAMMMWMRPKELWHFGLLVAAIATNYYALSQLKPNLDFHYDYGFWRCLGGFFTGVVTAYAYAKLIPFYKSLHKKSTAKARLYWGTLFEISVLLVLIGFIIYLPGKGQFFIAPFAFLFVLGFAFDMGGISKMFGLKPFRYFAKISYSIYMVHILFSLMFAIFAEKVIPIFAGPLWNATQFPGDLLLIPYLACVLLFSHYSFKFIEMPGRKALLAYDFKGKLSKIWTFRLFRKA